MTSPMRMSVKLPQERGDPVWTIRRVTATKDAQNLSNLEERPPRHLDREQIRAERQRRAGRLPDRHHGNGSQSTPLVRDAAKQTRIVAKNYTAAARPVRHALRDGPGPA